MKDIDGLLDEKLVRFNSKSEYPKIREVWGLLKALRMNENNLKRRVFESEKKLELLEAGNAPENGASKAALAEIQKQYEEKLTGLSVELNEVVTNANDQIVLQRKRIQELESLLSQKGALKITRTQMIEEMLKGDSEKKETITQIKETTRAPSNDDKNIWTETVLLSLTLFVGILNKWVLLINLKSLLWELLERRTRQCQPHKTSRKVRKVVWALLFVRRIQKMRYLKRENFQITQTSETNNTGARLFERLMNISQRYQKYSNCLMTALCERNNLTPSISLAEVFMKYFSQKNITHSFSSY